MPELGGFHVIAQLRRETEFALTPIVALTASAMRGDRERALSVGFTGYITKPIRLTDLRSEVQRLLRYRLLGHKTVDIDYFEVLLKLRIAALGSCNRF